MAEKVQKALQEYEEKLAKGRIDTFYVKITSNSVLLQAVPEGQEHPLHIPLSQELHHSLQIFFYDLEAITYGSFDYTTLKSLLNAHGILERMANKSSGRDKKN